jgi:hypothetical protein
MAPTKRDECFFFFRGKWMKPPPFRTGWGGEWDVIDLFFDIADSFTPQ